MINFLKKKEKTINLADLREPAIAPVRDWRIVLAAFLGSTVLLCVLAAYTFFSVMNGDVSAPESGEENKDISINEARLNRAVEFIQSRSGTNN